MYDKKPKAGETAIRCLPTLGLLPVLAVSAMVAGQAQAQGATDDEKDLGTIVLKAGQSGYLATESASGKATAPLLDAPKSVTVITRQQIEERGATSLTDVLRTTPGITLGAGEGGTAIGDRPSVRGFDATGDITIDGMRNVARTSYESFNLESIEVSKGPDGATSGRGGAGGAIGMYTKTPQDEDFADAAATYGTGNFRRGTLDFNRNYGDVGVRLNLMAQGADDLNGRKGVTSERYGIAPSLSYNFQDGSKLTTSLYYYVNHDMPDHGLTMSTAAIPDDLRGGGALVGGKWVGTSDNPFLPVRGQRNDIWFGLNEKDFRDQTSKYAQFQYERELGSWNWTTGLRIGDEKNNYIISKGIANTATSDKLKRGSTASFKTSESIVFNSQLAGKETFLGMEHSFAIGVDLSREENSTYGAKYFDAAGNPTTTVTYPNADYLNPNPNDPWKFSVARGDLTTVGKTYSKGLYVLDTVKIAPKWEATLGLRFDSYDTRYTVKDDVRDRGGNISLLKGTHRNDVKFANGTFGLTYKPNDNTALYGRIATSSNPSAVSAGIDATDGLVTDTILLDPERNKSYEIGAKWQNDAGNLMLTGAIFQIDKVNARVTDENGHTALIGNTRARGFELGISGQVTEQFALSGGYTYVDAVQVDAGYSNGLPSSNNGKKVGGVIPKSFSLWGTYQVNDQLTLGGGATYLSQRFANAANTAAVPSSVQIDVMAKYDLNDDTSLRFNVVNLFNETVFGSAHTNGSEQVNVGPARTVSLTLAHSF